MNKSDINMVLKKAEELKALFILGQRLLPFLEEIFVFVSEIQPLLDDINISIEENLKKMPNASKQLSKVTEATEMATTEIMDIVDGLFFKSDIISQNTKKLQSMKLDKEAKYLELLEIIHKGIQQGSDLKSVLPELSSLINTLKEKNDVEFLEVVKNIQEILDSLSMDSSSIMMALQVQDITSQQIAAVNNLLETVQKKLGTILDHFESSDVSSLVASEEKLPTTNISKMHRVIAFDPNAVDAIHQKDSRQQSVDSMIEEHHNQQNNIYAEAASQDDIDALFSSPEEFLQEDNEAISNDDIENLINSNIPNQETKEPSKAVEDDNAAFSQDDIDALFGN